MLRWDRVPSVPLCPLGPSAKLVTDVSDEAHLESLLRGADLLSVQMDEAAGTCNVKSPFWS